MPILEVRALRASGEGTAKGKPKTILSDVSFSIGKGQTFGLLGESGSGKSTLARSIAGLKMPDGGSIVFDGINIFPETEHRQQIGQNIQMLFQDHTASLDPRMTARKSLLEGFRREDGAPGEAILWKIAESYGLPKEVLGRRPDELSGGQRQRVALARAMAAEPKLLILDEPTSSLDAATQAAILQLVKKLQREKGFSVLYISHDLATTLLMSDEIGVMHDGVIVETTTPSELLRSQRHPVTREIVGNSFL